MTDPPARSTEHATTDDSAAKDADIALDAVADELPKGPSPTITDSCSGDGEIKSQKGQGSNKRSHEDDSQGTTNKRTRTIQIFQWEASHDFAVFKVLQKTKAEDLTEKDIWKLGCHIGYRNLASTLQRIKTQAYKRRKEAFELGVQYAEEQAEAKSGHFK